MPPEQRPIRVANFSGFYGDRASALADVVRLGDIDVATGDYLAEVTMLVLAKNRMKDPERGGVATAFLKHLAPVVDDIREQEIKVVTNAGGLNPRGLAASVQELAPQLRVAVVDGDDVLQRIRDGELDVRHLDDGSPLADWPNTPLTANAYLGAWGIAEALAEGADIVVTGRVTDASLAVGPAAWWHGWAREDYDAIAGAIVAGHVIECGAQATGGNYSGAIREGIDLVTRPPGFPIAEIAANGDSVITKPPDTGGAVTVGTVTAQLLYEVGGPGYLNPDAVARLDTPLLSQEGENRVRITGTKGEPPPDSLKVAITALGGFRNEIVFMLTGADVDAKAAQVERLVRERLPGGVRLDVQRIGTVAADAAGAADQGALTTMLRCVATAGPDGEKALGRAFSGALIELALSSYAGFYTLGLPGPARTYGTYFPGRVAREGIY